MHFQMSKGPVIIYDQGAPEENDILQEFFSNPARRADKTFRGPLDIAQ